MESNFDVGQNEQVLSPWVTLVTRRVQFPDDHQVQEYHSFKLADYSAVLAVTTEGKIPLVRQYRPAQRRFTLELPSGIVDPAEEPSQGAIRELREETGLQTDHVEPLGSLLPDSGRLENHVWGFLAGEVNPRLAAGWQPEPGLQNLWVSRQELQALILGGQFDHALHVAVIGLALARGCFSFTPAAN
jgi:ADP-ribose pyrophosphatase